MSNPCIELKLGDRTINVHAYTWKTDRHKRMCFDVREIEPGEEEESILTSNTADTDVAGYLVKEILEMLSRMVPTDTPTEEAGSNESVS